MCLSNCIPGVDGGVGDLVEDLAAAFEEPTPALQTTGGGGRCCDGADEVVTEEAIGFQAMVNEEEVQSPSRRPEILTGR